MREYIIFLKYYQPVIFDEREKMKKCIWVDGDGLNFRRFLYFYRSNPEASCIILQRYLKTEKLHQYHTWNLTQETTQNSIDRLFIFIFLTTHFRHLLVNKAVWLAKIKLVKESNLNCFKIINDSWFRKSCQNNESFCTQNLTCVVLNLWKWCVKSKCEVYW